MLVPHIGNVVADPDSICLESEPVFVPMLQREVRFVLFDYEEDGNRSEFHDAIAEFLKLPPAVLLAANNDIFRYYRDTVRAVDADDMPVIESPYDVWSHIELHDNVSLSRRGYGDLKVYVTVETECDWEPEHGLVFNFREGKRINKLGPFDGHVTNSDAHGDPCLEDVIYHSPF